MASNNSPQPIEPPIYRINRPELACKVFGRKLTEIQLLSPAVELDQLINSEKENSTEHIAFKIDAKHADIIKLVTKRLGDPVVILDRYAYFPSKFSLRSLRPRVHVLPELRKEDMEAVKAIAIQSYRFTRFYRDPFFPDSQCDELYSQIVGAYFEPCADDARGGVALRDGNVVGFLLGRVYSEINDGEEIKVLGRGFGAVLPGAEGCYPYLVQSGIACSLDCDRLEFDCQPENTAARRIFEFFGMELFSQTYVYHYTLSD